MAKGFILPNPLNFVIAIKVHAEAVKNLIYFTIMFIYTPTYSNTGAVKQDRIAYKQLILVGCSYIHIA